MSGVRIKECRFTGFRWRGFSWVGVVVVVVSCIVSPANAAALKEEHPDQNATARLTSCRNPMNLVIQM